MSNPSPQGFILSEAAMYAYSCQDVYPNLLDFAVAIPDHLKPLFLIPVSVEPAHDHSHLASRISNSPDEDLWGTKTFVDDDDWPVTTDTEEGSIFDIDGYWGRTKHQERPNYDENIQDPTDTSYMSDVDITDYFEYPYRTKEKPVRHSSVLIFKLALKPESLIPRTPDKIKTNAETCNVRLISYDKRGRVFTFGVSSEGKPEHQVRAVLSSIDDITLACSCPFWKWNGPEYNAKHNEFLLGRPRGTAAPPDVRDPDRQYWLCKHAYASIRRLDSFVQDVIEENWEADDEEILRDIDKNWDKMSAITQVKLDDIEAEEPEIDLEIEDESELEEETSEEESEETLDELEEEPELEEEILDEPEEEPEEEPEPEEETSKIELEEEELK
jgi:hypothetical protein